MAWPIPGSRRRLGLPTEPPSAYSGSPLSPDGRRWCVVSPLFDQRELVDVDVADPEPVSATGQVALVALVDLFGLDVDGLVFVSRQRGGPVVEGLDVVWLQALPAGQREARPCRMVLHRLDRR